jgi:hypothetical protein
VCVCVCGICEVKWFEVEVDYIIIYYLQMDILALDFFLSILYISFVSFSIPSHTDCNLEASVFIWLIY